MTIAVPGWVLYNIGTFLGGGFVVLLLLRWRRQFIKEEENKEELKRGREEKAAADADAEKLAKQTDADAEKLAEQTELDRLLPPVWRKLYEYLHGFPNMTKEAVLLSALSFKDDTKNIPMISPGGFNYILQVSYYNQGIPDDGPRQGHCHEAFTNILGDYVKFPA